MRLSFTITTLIHTILLASVSLAFLPATLQNRATTIVRDQPQPPASPPPSDLLRESASPFYVDDDENDTVCPTFFGDWESMTVAKLRAEVMLRQLPAKGNKSELVARLENDDEMKAPYVKF